MIRGRLGIEEYLAHEPENASIKSWSVPYYSCPLLLCGLSPITLKYCFYQCDLNSLYREEESPQMGL